MERVLGICNQWFIFQIMAHPLELKGYLILMGLIQLECRFLFIYRMNINIGI